MAQRKKLRASLLLLALPLIFSGARDADGFAGEDPASGGPWYHEEITELALASAGFSSQAAIDDIGWHADYIDSYLYNPQFWAFGGLDRFKVAQAITPELAKLHFDDNASSEEIAGAWRRYQSGTMAGLMWAAEMNDVAAARNILGVSLHAVQDFYSHSSWVDIPDQRYRTWLETAKSDRDGSWHYAGFYEHPDHLGIRSHGKISAGCTIVQLSAVESLLDVGCISVSPLSNTSICETYRSCLQNGESGTPRTVLGVPVPANVVYYDPPGIALDSRWLSEIGVQQRGLTDIGGGALFDRAYAMALRSSEQWLGTIEFEMNRLGLGDFWARIKSEAPMQPREDQYEDYHRFPFQFLSAGPYPSAVADTEWFLRVTLDTSNDANAGTNADIDLLAGGERFRLDYLPGAGPILAYNDFERGDRQVYTVGPFASMPNQIRLENQSANLGDVAEALVLDFIAAIGSVIGWVGNVLLTLVSGHADHIDDDQLVFTPQMLAAIGPGGATFPRVLNLDGRGQGHYHVNGTIRRGASHADGTDFIVRFTTLDCIKESTWDRGSGSDEPFVLMSVAPAPGNVVGARTDPYSDVDTGESRAINRSFTVRVPDGIGAIAVAASGWEHDDESAGARNQLLNEFLGHIDNETSDERQSVSDAIGAALAADWKVGRVHVYAFARGATVAGGTVLDTSPNHWIGGDTGRNYGLGAAPPARITEMRWLEELFPVAELTTIITSLR